MSSLDEMMDEMIPDSHANNVKIENIPDRKELLRTISAETLCTYVMMLFGQGVCAQNLFSQASSCAGNPSGAVSGAGSYLAINLGWGAGVFFGILIAGGVSGAHMNPAVSVAMAGLTPYIEPEPPP